VAVNLCLAWLIAGSGYRGRSGTDDSVPSTAITVQSSPRASNPPPVPRVKPAKPPFSWAELESEDPRRFAANLRAVRCPQHILTPLVLNLICHLEEQKLKRVPPSLPFAEIPAAMSAEVRIFKERQAIRAEADALGRELLGISVIQPMSSDDFALISAVATAMAGPMSDEQSTEFAMAMHRWEDVHEDLSGMPILASWREFQRLKAPWPGPVANCLSAHQRQSFASRLVALWLAISEDSGRFEWSMDELRQLGDRVAPQLPEIVSVEQMDRGMEARIVELVEQAIPAARSRDWQRARDRDFRDLARSGEPPETELARKVYDIKQQTEAAWLEALADPTLSTLSRDARVNELRRAAAAAVRDVLGESFKNYASGGRGWMLTQEPSR